MNSHLSGPILNSIDRSNFKNPALLPPWGKVGMGVLKREIIISAREISYQYCFAIIIRKYLFLKSCPNYYIPDEMIFHRALKYLNYTLLSKHRKGHGIHSPFVFDLINRVFRNKIDPNIVITIEKIRRKLIADKRIISFLDLGSGSAAGPGLPGERSARISDIAYKSPVTPKYGAFLAKMAKEFGDPLIIELGTSFGISTLYMAAACKDVKVITVEGSAEIAQIARQNFNEAGIKNITLIESSFDGIIENFTNEMKPGLVFIDGNHRKEPVMHYFNKIAEISGSGTVVIIDDINYSREMEEAWKEIKLHNRVSVTVDIFRMGICFFREGINPNNYVIRY